MSIFEGFPYDEIRDQQAEILRFVESNQDKRVFLINAPTGVGKSGIAIAIAKFFGEKAWILTETKALQDQYTSEFPHDVRSVKGKSSYKCNINKAFNVDQAPCVGHPDTKAKCITAKYCDYYNAFFKTMESKIAVTNYDYALGFSQSAATDYYTRDVVICDEGHVVEDKLINISAFEVNPKQLYERYKVDIDPALNFLNFDSVESICSFVHEAISKRIDAVEVEIANLPQGSQNDKGQRIDVDPNEQRLQRVSKSLHAISKRLRDYLADEEGDNWVTDFDDKGEVITITPLKSDGLFRQYFLDKLSEPFQGKVVLMSASLGDVETIMREFDLEEDEVCSIDVDTPFDPDKSPVVIMPGIKLGWRDFNHNKYDLITEVDDLLDLHPDEKGIIHSGNYKAAEWIANNSKHKDRFIFKEAGSFTSNNDLYLIHCMDDRPTVLISPSMHTGVDLKGDLSGFQIIAKLPFANMKNARVKAKMEDDPLWYSNQTWQKIIQACGRSTRSVDDESITYILDAATKYQYSKFKKHLPIWFTKRVQFI